MPEVDKAEHLRAHDATVSDGGPGCGGALQARITRAAVWTWCGACRRLTRPLVFPEPTGPVFMHAAAAA